MKEQDFITLLRSHSECLFDEKKFRAILNDLFPRDVQMNNILVNLFHLGLPREIEELQVINDPIYYKYKKKVVKIYGIDQKLADDAIRFWFICYGQNVLKRTVKISAMAPGVPGEQPANGIKEKNFNNCPFKVTLPQLTVLDGAVRINFKMQSKAGISVDVSLNEIYLSDKLNRKYDNYFMGECKPKEKGNKTFDLSVPIDKRYFLLSDSVVILCFLAGDQRRYEICYSLNRNTGIALDYVMGRRLSNEEILRLEESIRQAKEKEKGEGEGKGPAGEEGENGGGEDNSGGTSYQIPKLDEYKKALLREKYFLQNEGGRKHKVTNGTLLNHKNGLSTYSFEMEAELNLSDDAPITLYVGANEATGSVLVVNVKTPA